VYVDVYLVYLKDIHLLTWFFLRVSYLFHFLLFTQTLDCFGDQDGKLVPQVTHFEQKDPYIASIFLLFFMFI